MPEEKPIITADQLLSHPIFSTGTAQDRATASSNVFKNNMEVLWSKVPESASDADRQKAMDEMQQMQTGYNDFQRQTQAAFAAKATAALAQDQGFTREDVSKRLAESMITGNTDKLTENERVVADDIRAANDKIGKEKIGLMEPFKINNANNDPVASGQLMGTPDGRVKGVLNFFASNERDKNGGPEPSAIVDLGTMDQLTQERVSEAKRLEDVSIEKTKQAADEKLKADQIEKMLMENPTANAGGNLSIAAGNARDNAAKLTQEAKMAKERWFFLTTGGAEATKSLLSEKMQKTIKANKDMLKHIPEGESWAGLPAGVVQFGNAMGLGTQSAFVDAGIGVAGLAEWATNGKLATKDDVRGLMQTQAEMQSASAVGGPNEWAMDPSKTEKFAKMFTEELGEEALTTLLGLGISKGLVAAGRFGARKAIKARVEKSIVARVAAGATEETANRIRQSVASGIEEQAFKWGKRLGHAPVAFTEAIYNGGQELSGTIQALYEQADSLKSEQAMWRERLKNPPMVQGDTIEGGAMRPPQTSPSKAAWTPEEIQANIDRLETEQKKLEENAGTAYLSTLAANTSLEYIAWDRLFKRSQDAPALMDLASRALARKNLATDKAFQALGSAAKEQAIDQAGRELLKNQTKAVLENADVISALSRVKSAMSQGKWEAVTETLQSVTSNAFIKNFIDKNQGVVEGVPESALVGFLLGSLGGAISAQSNKTEIMMAYAEMGKNEQSARKRSAEAVTSGEKLFAGAIINGQTPAFPAEDTVKQVKGKDTFEIVDPNDANNYLPKREFATMEEAHEAAKTRWRDAFESSMLSSKFTEKLKAVGVDAATPEGKAKHQADVAATVSLIGKKIEALASNSNVTTETAYMAAYHSIFGDANRSDQYDPVKDGPHPQQDKIIAVQSMIRDAEQKASTGEPVDQHRLATLKTHAKQLEKLGHNPKNKIKEVDLSIQSEIETVQKAMFSHANKKEPVAARQKGRKNKGASISDEAHSAWKSRLREKVNGIMQAHGVATSGVEDINAKFLSKEHRNWSVAALRGAAANAKARLEEFAHIQTPKAKASRAKVTAEIEALHELADMKESGGTSLSQSAPDPHQDYLARTRAAMISAPGLFSKKEREAFEAQFKNEWTGENKPLESTPTEKTIKPIIKATMAESEKLFGEKFNYREPKPRPTPDNITEIVEAYRSMDWAKRPGMEFAVFGSVAGFDAYDRALTGMLAGRDLAKLPAEEQMAINRAAYSTYRAQMASGVVDVFPMRDKSNLVDGSDPVISVPMGDDKGGFNKIKTGARRAFTRHYAKGTAPQVGQIIKITDPGNSWNAMYALVTSASRVSEIMNRFGNDGVAVWAAREGYTVPEAKAIMSKGGIDGKTTQIMFIPVDRRYAQVRQGTLKEDAQARLIANLNLPSASGAHITTPAKPGEERLGITIPLGNGNSYTFNQFAQDSEEMAQFGPHGKREIVEAMKFLADFINANPSLAPDISFIEDSNHEGPPANETGAVKSTNKTKIIRYGKDTTSMDMAASILREIYAKIATRVPQFTVNPIPSQGGNPEASVHKNMFFRLMGFLPGPPENAVQGSAEFKTGYGILKDIESGKFGVTASATDLANSPFTYNIHIDSKGVAKFIRRDPKTGKPWPVDQQYLQNSEPYGLTEVALAPSVASLMDEAYRGFTMTVHRGSGATGNQAAGAAFPYTPVDFVNDMALAPKDLFKKYPHAPHVLSIQKFANVAIFGGVQPTSKGSKAAYAAFVGYHLGREARRASNEQFKAQEAKIEAEVQKIAAKPELSTEEKAKGIAELNSYLSRERKPTGDPAIDEYLQAQEKSLPPSKVTHSAFIDMMESNADSQQKNDFLAKIKSSDGASKLLEMIGSIHGYSDKKDLLAIMRKLSSVVGGSEKLVHAGLKDFNRERVGVALKRLAEFLYIPARAPSPESEPRPRPRPTEVPDAVNPFKQESLYSKSEDDLKEDATRGTNKYNPDLLNPGLASASGTGVQPISARPYTREDDAYAALMDWTMRFSVNSPESDGILFDPNDEQKTEADDDSNRESDQDNPVAAEDEPLDFGADKKQIVELNTGGVSSDNKDALNIATINAVLETSGIGSLLMDDINRSTAKKIGVSEPKKRTQDDINSRATSIEESTGAAIERAAENEEDPDVLRALRYVKNRSLEENSQENKPITLNDLTSSGGFTLAHLQAITDAIDASAMTLSRNADPAPRKSDKELEAMVAASLEAPNTGFGSLSNAFDGLNIDGQSKDSLNRIEKAVGMIRNVQVIGSDSPEVKAKKDAAKQYLAAEVWYKDRINPLVKMLDDALHGGKFSHEDVMGLVETLGGLLDIEINTEPSDEVANKVRDHLVGGEPYFEGEYEDKTIGEVIASTKSKPLIKAALEGMILADAAIRQMRAENAMRTGDAKSRSQQAINMVVARIFGANALKDIQRAMGRPKSDSTPWFMVQEKDMRGYPYLMKAISAAALPGNTPPVKGVNDEAFGGPVDDKEFIEGDKPKRIIQPDVVQPLAQDQQARLLLDDEYRDKYKQKVNEMVAAMPPDDIKKIRKFGDQLLTKAGILIKDGDEIAFGPAGIHEEMLRMLATQELVARLRGQVPPGVGHTTLGRVYEGNTMAKLQEFADKNKDEMSDLHLLTQHWLLKNADEAGPIRLFSYKVPVTDMTPESGEDRVDMPEHEREYMIQEYAAENGFRAAMEDTGFVFEPGTSNKLFSVTMSKKSGTVFVKAKPPLKELLRSKTHTKSRGYLSEAKMILKELGGDPESSAQLAPMLKMHLEGAAAEYHKRSAEKEILKEARSGPTRTYSAYQMVNPNTGEAIKAIDAIPGLYHENLDPKKPDLVGSEQMAQMPISELSGGMEAILSPFRWNSSPLSKQNFNLGVERIMLDPELANIKTASGEDFYTVWGRVEPSFPVEDRQGKVEAFKSMLKVAISSSPDHRKSFEQAKDNLEKKTKPFQLMYRGPVTPQFMPRSTGIDSRPITIEEVVVKLINEDWNPGAASPELYQTPDSSEEQRAPDLTPKGRIMVDSAEKIIELFNQKADVSTILHEFVHWLDLSTMDDGTSLLQATLGKNYDPFMRWASGNEKYSDDRANKPEQWRIVRERVAVSLEQYLREGTRSNSYGRMTDTRAQAALRTLGRTISNIYKAVRGAIQGVAIDDRVRRAWDDVFVFGEGAKSKAFVNPRANGKSRITNQRIMDKVNEMQRPPPQTQADVENLAADISSEDLGIMEGMNGKRNALMQIDAPESLGGGRPIHIPIGSSGAVPAPTSLGFRMTASSRSETKNAIRGALGWIDRNLTTSAGAMRDDGILNKIIGRSTEREMVLSADNWKSAMTEDMAVIAKVLDDELNHAAKQEGGALLHNVNRARQKIAQDMSTYLSHPDVSTRYAAWMNLPTTTLQDACIDARNYLDDASEDLLRLGIIDSSLTGIVSTIRGRMGFYVHRKFHGSKNPNWKEVVKGKPGSDRNIEYTKQINEIIRIRSTPAHTLTFEDAETIAQDAMDTVANQESIAKSQESDRTTAASLLMPRTIPEDIEGPLHILLAVESDPTLMFRDTATGLIQLITGQVAQANILNYALAKGFVIHPDDAKPDDTRNTSIMGLTKPLDPSNPEDIAKMAMYGPLAGYKATALGAKFYNNVFGAKDGMPDIADTHGGKKILWAIAKTLVHANGWYKKTKTVFSPSKYLVNGISSYLTYVTSGNAVGGIYRGSKSWLSGTMTGPESEDALRSLNLYDADWKALMANGVFDSSTIQELKFISAGAEGRGRGILGRSLTPTGTGAVLTDVAARTRQEVEGMVMGVARKTGAVMSAAFAAGDTLPKLWAYHAEVQKVQAMFPALHIDSVKSLAALRTSQAMFTFNRNPVLVKYLAKYSPVGGWITYPAGISRALFQSFGIGVSDIMEGTRRKRAGEAGAATQIEMGVARLGSIGLVTVGLQAALAWMLARLGWTEDKVKQLSDSGAIKKWAKNEPFIPLDGPKVTNPRIIPLGPVLPYTYLTGRLGDACDLIKQGAKIVGLAEKDTDESRKQVWDTFKQMALGYTGQALDPLLSQTWASKMIGKISGNMDNKMSSLYVEGDEYGTVTRIARATFEDLIPGAIITASRLGLMPKSEILPGETNGDNWEKALMTFGAPTIVADVHEGFRRQMRETNVAYQANKLLLERKLTSKESMTNEELNAAIAENKKVRDHNISVASRSYLAAKEYGANPYVLLEAAKASFTREAGTAPTTLINNVLYGRKPEAVELSDSVLFAIIGTKDQDRINQFTSAIASGKITLTKTSNVDKYHISKESVEGYESQTRDRGAVLEALGVGSDTSP